VVPGTGHAVHLPATGQTVHLPGTGHAVHLPGTGHAVHLEPPSRVAAQIERSIEALARGSVMKTSNRV
jgi:pimeloyl-ACP methyl ester carboxylesterase